MSRLQSILTGIATAVAVVLVVVSIDFGKLVASFHQVTTLSVALAAVLLVANVLLAYLLSEMQGAVFDLLHLGNWYDSLSQGSLAAAITRSVGCAIGFRLKL